jgi:hypothetical protein
MYTLGSIDILNGGCGKKDGQSDCVNFHLLYRLNKRCSQSRTDYVFMFLTVVVLSVMLTLTFFHTRK